jgi:hypothetical protein
MNYYYWKHIGLNIPGFWKSIAAILPGLFAPGLAGYLINRFWFMDSFMDILLSALVISVVFGVSVWLFSMTEYEKNLFKKPLQKILHR